MLVAAAVCPHPPLLVPEVAAGAAAETEPLRRACRSAVDVLAAAAPDVLFVVGGAAARLAYSDADWGDLGRYGVSRAVRLGPGACSGRAILPLSLTIGAWLLKESGWRGDRQGYGVPEELDPAECAAIGVEIAAVAGRVALLCMGDGSARRSEQAPGYVDPRAAGFDVSVARALASADRDALLGLDAALARDLLVAGRASWQVLAGAATTGEWAGEVHYDEAPYGVGYLVATWIPQRAGA